jgi:electron transfer flavoprotein alpha subunit
VSVLVVTEQRDSTWNRMSFETLAAGQEIASALQVPLAAAVLGENCDELASELAAYQLDAVYAVQHNLLAQYTADGYTLAIEQLIKQVSPQFVLFPHSYQVRDFAPKLATRFDRSLISDAVSLKIEARSVVFVRQLFQGKLNADLVVNPGGITFASLQAGSFRAAETTGAAAKIVPIQPELAPDQIRSRPEKPFLEAQRTVDLANAEVIVSVGRGIKEKENLKIVEELAASLGAELAASRPICDNGWLPMERQVGSSGQTVAPKAYFAVGISGAIQHLVGMKSARTIVAINKDENAPIFEVADYGIVGDLFEVVPALIAEFKKLKN